MKNREPVQMAAAGLYERVLSFLPKENNKRITILDAGAGSGALSFQLKKMGFQVWACDKNPKQFQVADTFCKQANLNEKIPFKNNLFDYVISLETIEHLEDPWNFLREVQRVLKPKGTVILSTPNNTHISSRVFYLIFGRFIAFWSRRYLEYNWHINPIFYWNLEFMLDHTGFKVTKRTYNQGKLFPLYKIFFKNSRLYFGSPMSINYLPKCDLFGENLIVIAQKK